MRKFFFTICYFTVISAYSQSKPPLVHSVYDEWQSINEKKISNDGKWVVYVISPQEGDGWLVTQSADAKYKNTIPRGYSAVITDDNRFVIFKIKPFYKDTRQALLKKKKPDDFPKDSLAILELGKDSIAKFAGLFSFKIPQKNGQWVAWQQNKPLKDSSLIRGSIDSVRKFIDSIHSHQVQPTPGQAKKRKKITNPPVIKDNRNLDVEADFLPPGDNTNSGNIEEGNPLVIYNLQSGQSYTVPLVNNYQWSKDGNILLLQTSKDKSDSLRKTAVIVFRTVEQHFDTIQRGGNEFRNFAIDDEGRQVAFTAERDSSTASTQFFYKLWYWKNGFDTAVMLADKNMIGMPIGWGISENAVLKFSKSGKRLFAGAAPLQPSKDTSLVDIDLVNLDIWNYKDDYLQPMQLKNLDHELKRSYLSMIDLVNKRYVQLADIGIPTVITDADGDGENFLGITDTGMRVSMQWEGHTKKDIYAIRADDGSRTLVKKSLTGAATLSPAGKYIFWYDNKFHNYFTWRKGVIKNITSRIPVKLYDEEFDMPDTPSSYGVMAWTQSDLAVLIYDRYDIWQLDPADVLKPFNITEGTGRKSKTKYRYIQTDPEETYIAPSQSLLLSTFNELNKHSGFSSLKLVSDAKPVAIMSGAFALDHSPLKAANANVFTYTKESYIAPPDLFVNNDWQKEVQLSHINPQQSKYNWGTAELFTWRAYNGKAATGIVYKPEDYNPKKKYPAICYFYEKLSNGLYNYIPPAPTPSKLNISFFVSRGYIVFVPDISYSIGYPGKSAYNYIVSGIRELSKKGWVDSTRLGIQGQSWGGYQTAYVITQTKLFKAAWAGAPVANMTSAYGGIRWESGMNRQFQYEKTQSRIGATLWENPQLYIQNSPLFYLPKVQTPLVIMHNDNDGAVPWYQGIELSTGLRRLNKPVWLLNYNGEAHNLMQRKNRKDIQIREQQFFDWLLKGDRPAQWLREGVPATMKGKIWGL